MLAVDLPDDAYPTEPNKRYAYRRRKRKESKKAQKRSKIRNFKRTAIPLLIFLAVVLLGAIVVSYVSAPVLTRSTPITGG